MCQDDRKALLCLAGKTEHGVLLMTQHEGCKDHSHSKGGQEKGRQDMEDREDRNWVLIQEEREYSVKWQMNRGK